MKPILEHQFNFIKENKYSISSTFLEPIDISDKNRIEFNFEGKFPLELEVTFMDNEKNFYCIKALANGIEKISNTKCVSATKMIVRTDLKALVSVKISK